MFLSPSPSFNNKKETINLILTRGAERNGKQGVKKYLEIKNRAGVEAYSEEDMTLHFDQHEVIYPHCSMLYVI
jgi:hypothetical protein